MCPPPPTTSRVRPPRAIGEVPGSLDPCARGYKARGAVKGADSWRESGERRTERYCTIGLGDVRLLKRKKVLTHRETWCDRYALAKVKKSRRTACYSSLVPSQGHGDPPEPRGGADPRGHSRRVSRGWRRPRLRDPRIPEAGAEEGGGRVPVARKGQRREVSRSVSTSGPQPQKERRARVGERDSSSRLATS